MTQLTSKQLPNKHLKNSAYFLVATGILHNIIGLGIGFSVLSEILQEGLFNTINAQYDRNAMFWFLFSGFAMMLWGSLFFQLKRVPESFSWSLLVLSLLGVFIMPVSGIWLIIPQAIYMLWYQRKHQSFNQLKPAT